MHNLNLARNANVGASSSSAFPAPSLRQQSEPPLLAFDDSQGYDVGQAAVSQLPPIAELLELIRAHNASRHMDDQDECQSVADTLGLQDHFFAYVYPVLLVLCVFGNAMNLVVYAKPFLRGSTTIYLLSAKAVANTFYLLCLLPYAFRAYSIFQDNQYVLRGYWHSLLWFVFLANTFGTAAAWLTVATVLERYIFVGYPVHAKVWCTTRSANLGILTSVALSAALQVYHVVNREVSEQSCYLGANGTLTSSPPNDGSTAARYVRSKFNLATVYPAYDTAYNWLTAVLAIVSPTVVLIVLTVAINYELFYRRSQFASNTEQKRCVNRLTLATTATFLALEMCQVPVFVLAAIQGPDAAAASQTFQNFSAVANFLSMTNAAIPFFIYLVCSQRFRMLCKLALCPGMLNTMEREALTTQRTVRSVRGISQTAGASSSGKSSCVKYTVVSPTDGEENGKLVIDGQVQLEGSDFK